MKGFFDIGGVESGRLNIIKIIDLGILFDFWNGYAPLLLCQVGLIANKKNTHSFGSLLFQLLHPVVYVHKCLMIGYIVNDERAHSSPVIWRCYGSVPLLSGCVPYLRFNRLIVIVYGFSSKFNTNRGLAFQIELILGKPAQQLRLAHTRISNKYNFEQEVVLLWVTRSTISSRIKCCH